MADTSTDPIQLKLKIKGVELIKSQINQAVPNFSVQEFQFTLKLETRLDPVQQVVIVIISADVKSDNKPDLLANISSACIFGVDNFDEIFKKKSDGIYEVPNENMMFPFISISISTMRGIIFEQFRGTYLHNAFLPIFDPKQFKMEQNNVQ